MRTPRPSRHCHRRPTGRRPQAAIPGLPAAGHGAVSRAFSPWHGVAAAIRSSPATMTVVCECGIPCPARLCSAGIPALPNRALYRCTLWWVGAVGGRDGSVKHWFLQPKSAMLKSSVTSVNNSTVKSTYVSKGGNWYCVGDAIGNVTFWEQAARRQRRAIARRDRRGRQLSTHFLSDQRRPGDRLMAMATSRSETRAGQGRSHQAWNEVGNPAITAVAFTPDGGSLCRSRRRQALALESRRLDAKSRTNNWPSQRQLGHRGRFRSRRFADDRRRSRQHLC